MGSSPEPLLPAEDPRPFPLKLWILIGGAVVVLGGVLAIVLIPSRRPPADEPSTSSPAPGSGGTGPKTGGAKESSSRSTPAGAEEKAAQELFAAAEAFDRATPGEPEKVMAQYFKAFQAHPTTTWGRKAEQKYRQINDSFQAALERDFQGVKKDAQTLAATGHYLDAIEAVRTYLKEQPREALHRRAEREIASLENACREAFNVAARQAQALARNGEYPKAAALFEGLKSESIPEVAQRCDAAITQLQEAAKAFDTSAASKQTEEALKAFREGAGPRVLALLRARRYEEGLKEFDAAAADPAAAPLRADLARERAAIVLAAAFWDAFLKAFRARLNQDVLIATAGPKETRIAGKLVRLDADRASLETADGTAEVTLDKIHADPIVAWTMGKTLPADDAGTYVKAALFFFVDGRDELAGLYLATAKEMGADIAEPERVFREGLLRAVRKK